MKNFVSLIFVLVLFASATFSVKVKRRREVQFQAVEMTNEFVTPQNTLEPTQQSQSALLELKTCCKTGKCNCH